MQPGSERYKEKHKKNAGQVATLRKGQMVLVLIE